MKTAMMSGGSMASQRGSSEIFKRRVGHETTPIIEPDLMAIPVEAL